MPQGSFLSVITAIALGGALGFVMQRGRFCLNSAFRDIIFVKDYTMFRAYLLCVVVAIIGSNFLETMGWLSGVNAQSQQTVVYSLLRQNFVPVANIVGGFLFGLGIVLAGGCASGIVYRLGEGQVSALIATFGFFFGIVMTQSGLISPAHKFLSSLKLSVGGVSNPALWDFFGGGTAAKWVTIAAFCAAALVFVFKGKPTFGKSGKGYSWGLTGLLLGLLTASAWWVSSRYGGMPRGLAITTPLREAFSSLLFNHSYSPFPEFSFFGIFNGTWGVFFIFAVPLGAYVSALGLKEFKLKTPPAREALTVFFGSILMGIGAVIAGGCNLGHGVTGMSTMAVSSLVAISSIVLGNWTMVYFKFIKPMEEME